MQCNDVMECIAMDCVCVFVYMCLIMRLCIYVSTYRCIYVSTYLCIYVCTYACMYVSGGKPAKIQHTHTHTRTHTDWALQCSILRTLRNEWTHLSKFVFSQPVVQSFETNDVAWLYRLRGCLTMGLSKIFPCKEMQRVYSIFISSWAKDNPWEPTLH